MFRPRPPQGASCSRPTASPSPASPRHLTASVAKRMTVTVSTLAPDAYGRRRRDHRQRRPVQALRLRGDEADPRRPQRRRREPGRRCSAACAPASRTARACSAPTRCDANGDTTTAHLRPLRRQQASRSSGKGADHRGLAGSSSAIPSSVSAAGERSARRARRASRPAGSASVDRLAAQQRARDDVAAAHERDRVRAGRRAARRRRRTPRGGAARSASARRIRSSFGGGSASAARRSSQSTGRRLSGSTSERQSSSSPW